MQIISSHMHGVLINEYGTILLRTFSGYPNTTKIVKLGDSNTFIFVTAYENPEVKVFTYF